MCWTMLSFWCAIIFAVGAAERQEIAVEVGKEYPIENPGAPGESPSNSDVEWVLTSTGNTIVLKCHELSLYRLSEDCKDYSFLVSGAKGPKVYCGNLNPFEERSMDTITLRLRTGQWDAGRVKCKATAVLGDGYDTVNVHLKLNDDAYLIENPNYPKQAPPSTLKRWVVTAEPGLKIGLTCRDIRYPGGKDCHNYGLGLIIYDGTNETVACKAGSWVTLDEPKITVTYKSATGSGMVSCRAVAVKSGQFSDYFREVVSEEVDSSEHGVVPGRSGTTCPCGWANNEDSRIIGGRESLPNEYSFMVALLYKQAQFCGGSILTPDYVLTAAHCTQPIETNEIQVLVGAHNLIQGQESKWARVHDVVEKREHENYDAKDSFIHDIAILKLKTPIDINEKVGPVCLPTNVPRLNNQRIRVMGWGLTKQGASKVLLKLDMKALDPITCKSTMASNIDIQNPSKACFFSNKKDTCNGDSGGPFVWLDPDTNRYTQVSLVSYGRGCASDNPSVGTNVTYYVDWIRNVIEGPGCSKI